ncbi:MAG: Two-component sensor histidine kinase [Parcubacteria group bacterium GW2011_GWD2_38_11]|nr:MAG: Two-component sensor histidine kinase [Parcubacteria group bacterium GW2011_GWD2_38_11]
MKELIRRGIVFVKNNPTIISSLLLIFVVIGALFLNSYFILARFQENSDKILRAKAVLAEDIIGVAAEEHFANLSEDSALLEQKIIDIQENDPEIAEIAVYLPTAINNFYEPIISAKNVFIDEVDKPEAEKITQNAIKFSLSIEDAFAYVSSSGESRYWNVVKAVHSKDGTAEGVLRLKLSLAENDRLVGKIILQVYVLSIGAMLVVLLLVLNHIRLFAFELRAKKLEEIDQMKDDFISMASHELKSPLTSIRGYAELLADTLEKDGGLLDSKVQQKKYLTNINISVSRLKTLVEDLLDVSRIEQNRLPIALVETDLAKIVLEIADEMSVLASEKGLEIKRNVANVSKVSADPERLKQIIVNLLSNAIKYTPSGSVEIKIEEDDNYAFLTIADTGLGISAEDMKKLFSKFYRVKTQHTAGIAGTGLGLWIAREIAQKMGGDLKVESIEGVGSHFTLSLKK